MAGYTIHQVQGESSCWSPDFLGGWEEGEGETAASSTCINNYVAPYIHTYMAVNTHMHTVRESCSDSGPANIYFKVSVEVILVGSMERNKASWQMPVKML